MKKIIIAGLGIISAFSLAVVFSYGAIVGGPWVKSIQATSVLEPEKGTYAEGNLMDLTDDSWCEGKKDSGTGESVTIRLDAPATVKALYIKNGIGIQKFWGANNRVKDVVINGRSYTLKDVPGFQQVPVDLKAVDKIMLTIKSVYRGEKYDDTCIAEIGFSDPGGSYNKPDNFATITGKTWVVPEGMEGAVVTFTKGFLVTTDVVPCGDETCPISSVGSCRRLGPDKYDCRFVEHCQGTYDPKLNLGGKRCSPRNDAFTLDVSGEAPVVTMKGKKTTLKLFD